MRAINRAFSALLFVLFLFVGLSLVGSWRLRYRLLSTNAIYARLATDLSHTDPGQRQKWLKAIQKVQEWDSSAQIVSLGFACVLCTFGLGMRVRAAREAGRIEEAKLEREQRALEKRIEERTRELSQEVEERRRAEDLNRGQKQVLEMLADPRHQKTEDILYHLTATLAAQQQSWECALHLMDPLSKTLQLAASTDVGEGLRRYLASAGADFPDAPEGQAGCLSSTYVIEKLTDVQRPWSELLVANGIFSAWSVPFRSRERVVGTITVYCRLQSGPSPHDLELIEAAAGLAALVIEHRRIHDELVHNAYHDVLTGVSNRRGGVLALQYAFENAQQRQEPLSLFWIDLDRFKRINDQYGHGVGDEVLGALARRLSSHPLVKGNLARMGGDEFVVLIPGQAAVDDSANICQQLLEAIAAPIATSAGVLCVGGSIGVCSYPRGGMSSQALERNSDFAMYRAKSAGTRFCIFSPAMDDELSESLELEEALRRAIEHRQLRMVYQPIYSCAGGLNGFEALVRFRSSKLGEISPSRFIPKAEETRLIVPIGEWVLRQACRQLNAWLAAGFAPVRMGVNISAVQIARDDFAESIAAILNESGVPPELLTLELTETAVMDNPEAAARQMFLLKGFGVRLALDDFGTGYSSLSYLHKLPIDVLKIDQSFTGRLAETDGTRAIVEAVIAMARHLSVYVVAEGVETMEQQRILEQAGCDALQGFLFARPLSPEEAQDCLAANSGFLRMSRAISA